MEPLVSPFPLEPVRSKAMPPERLTLSNRQENLKALRNFINRWAREHALPAPRRGSLEEVAREIFQHLLSHAYFPDQAGTIAVALEKKGSRVRLRFEDDAEPHRPGPDNGVRVPEVPSRPGCDFYLNRPFLNRLPQIADSLIYYRTADRKNRLVVFLT